MARAAASNARRMSPRLAQATSVIFSSVAGLTTGINIAGVRGHPSAVDEKSRFHSY